MSRLNEHDAHQELARPKTFTDGYLQCKRELKEAAKDQVWQWFARCAFAFAIGAILGWLRGAL